MNIRDVLQQHGDLFTQKVKEIYWMNGYYNFGCAEQNTYAWLGDDGDCWDAAQTAQILMPHTTTEYFSLEGGDVCTGYGFVNQSCGDGDNPVRKAYQDWLWNVGGGCRPSWDPIAVYAAIYGYEAAGMWANDGTDEVDENGYENWDDGWTSNNEFEIWFNNDNAKQDMEDSIEYALCAGSAYAKAKKYAEYTQ